jgi:type IV fimbrial biogenesis protein FimT
VLNTSAARGFSLIELMVTLAVMAILALLVSPSMARYTENAKVHATAELFYASVQQARTEAIRRNASVELVLTSQAPTAANVETTGLAAGGPNWMVRQAPATSSGTHVFIEGKAGAEGGGRAGGGTSVVIAASTSSLEFTTLGALDATAAATVNFSSQGGTCAPAGETRCLRVVVSTGGQARLCDPAVTAANDTRKC